MDIFFMSFIPLMFILAFAIGVIIYAKIDLKNAESHK